MSAITNEAAAKMLSKIATGEALDKMRLAVVRKQSSLDTDIHVWLLSEIKEIEKHRNPTKLNQTLSKLEGMGSRMTAIHMFIQVFANVKMTDATAPSKGEKSERKTLSDGKDYTVFYKVKSERKTLSFFTGRKDGKAVYSTPIAYNKADETGMSEYLALAARKPWWEFRPEPEARAFDFDKVPTQIAGNLKRAFAEVHKQGSFKGAQADFLADLYKVIAQHHPELTADITEAFENELPKDAPAEISNVIKFTPRATTEVNVTPKAPAKKKA